MNLKKTVAATVAALTIGVGGLTVAVPAVSAATSPTSTESANRGTRPHHRRQAIRASIKVAADTIGIAPKDLVAELKAGKSVAEVATASEVDPAAVVSALVAKGTARIDSALEAGKISAERAEKLKARLPKAADKFVNWKRPAA